MTEFALNVYLALQRLSVPRASSWPTAVDLPSTEAAMRNVAGSGSTESW